MNVLKYLIFVFPRLQWGAKQLFILIFVNIAKKLVSK